MKSSVPYPKYFLFPTFDLSFQLQKKKDQKKLPARNFLQKICKKISAHIRSYFGLKIFEYFYLQKSTHKYLYISSVRYNYRFLQIQIFCRFSAENFYLEYIQDYEEGAMETQFALHYINFYQNCVSVGTFSFHFIPLSSK